MKNIRKEIKTSYSISWESFLELERASKLCGISIPDMIKIVISPLRSEAFPLVK